MKNLRNIKDANVRGLLEHAESPEVFNNHVLRHAGDFHELTWFLMQTADEEKKNSLYDEFRERAFHQQKLETTDATAESGEKLWQFCTAPNEHKKSLAFERFADARHHQIRMESRLKDFPESQAERLS